GAECQALPPAIFSGQKLHAGAVNVAVAVGVDGVSVPRRVLAVRVREAHNPVATLAVVGVLAHVLGAVEQRADGREGEGQSVHGDLRGLGVADKKKTTGVGGWSKGCPVIEALNLWRNVD